MEPTPVIPYDSPVMIELDMEHPGCGAGVCPIVDGVCCPSGNKCCPELCVKVNITREECRLSDAHQAELLHAKVLIRKQKLDEQERQMNEELEREELKARAKLQRQKEHEKWEKKVAEEKQNLINELNSKKKSVIEKLKKLASSIGMTIDQVVPKDVKEKLQGDSKESNKESKAKEKELALKAETEKDPEKRKQLSNQRTEQHEKNTRVTLEKGYSNFSPDTDLVYDVLRVQQWRDLCFISGTVKGKGELIGRVPNACKPQGGRLAFSVLKENKPARVDILPDGRIFMVTPDVEGWVSLSGIVYNRKNSTEIFTRNGWSKNGGEYSWPYVSEFGGICTLNGMIKGSKWGLLGEVPDNCVPDRRMILSANNNAHPVRIDVLKNKTLTTVSGTYKNNWLALDGAIWSTQTGELLTLKEGWENHEIGNRYRAANYKRIGNVVILSGLVKKIQNARSGDVIGQLPPGYRPLNRLIFGSNHHTSLSRIDVLVNGDIVYVEKEPTNWVALDGVAFYALRDDFEKARDEENRVEIDVAKREGRQPTVNRDAGDVLAGALNTNDERENIRKQIQDSLSSLGKIEDDIKTNMVNKIGA